MPTPTIPNAIDCGECLLRPVQQSNKWVVEELFQSPDVLRFYVLREDHAENISEFCQYLIIGNVKRTSVNFIIYDRSDNEVGLITAEVMMNDQTGKPMWNVGYAILPTQRKKGYASTALNGLTRFLFQKYAVPQVMLDISTENVASEKVARKCGFVKAGNSGYFDLNQTDPDMRFRWYKQKDVRREILFMKAVQYFRNKSYEESASTFKQALEEPYTPGSPCSDAQIYSNMGMALSSSQHYYEAFASLKKAQALGLNNPSIEKELNWLRIHQGLF